MLRCMLSVRQGTLPVRSGGYVPLTWQGPGAIKTMTIAKTKIIILFNSKMHLEDYVLLL